MTTHEVRVAPKVSSTGSVVTSEGKKLSMSKCRLFTIAKRCINDGVGSLRHSWRFLDEKVCFPEFEKELADFAKIMLPFVYSTHKWTNFNCSW